LFPYSNAKDRRVTQDLKSYGEIITHPQCSVDEKKIKKIRVYHIRIIAATKIGSHDMKSIDSSIIIVKNVCVLTSASMIAYLFLWICLFILLTSSVLLLFLRLKHIITVVYPIRNGHFKMADCKSSKR
jgi:hypothetical protein